MFNVMAIKIIEQIAAHPPYNTKTAIPTNNLSTVITQRYISHHSYR